MADTIKAEPDGHGRWQLVDMKTGTVVDDAQGYGYKTAAGAHRAWTWKHRTPEQKSNARKAIAWWHAHKSVARETDGILFDDLKDMASHADQTRDLKDVITGSGEDLWGLPVATLAHYFYKA